MRHRIRQVAPDLIGTQEGLYEQLKDLASDLPDYEWIGLAAKGGVVGEFMAVFYLRLRFEPLGYDDFWLSDMLAVSRVPPTRGNSQRPYGYLGAFPRSGFPAVNPISGTPTSIPY